jgi:demethylmenaquinone methyltransferase/2-methoxy-6-polyprenyl-1,4-benzoquinol methylase
MTGNSAPPERVSEMFDRISGVYDGMNLLISGFQEPRWRRRAVAETKLGPGDRALDVACGTGTVTRDLLRAVQPGGSVTGVDASAGMVARARMHDGDAGSADVGSPAAPTFLVGDALELPVEDHAFDAATIAFGMRNLADYERGFREMARAVRPGGRVVCLEIARPTSLLGRLAGRWFDHVVPLIGRLVGQGDAYAYLVRSTRAYPSPERIAAIMRDAGLRHVDWYGLSFGMVTIHTGIVAPPVRGADSAASAAVAAVSGPSPQVERGG